MNHCPEAGLTASVVIPTFNRCGVLQRLLESLDHQTDVAGRFEVVVAVDGATDGTVDMLAGLRTTYPLRVVTQPNSGPAAARNRALRAAAGDIVVFLDDDVLPVPNLVRQHLDLHARDARAVAIGALSLPTADLTPWAEWEARTLRKHFEALHMGRKPLRARHLYTGNASVRREQALEVGGFDETFRRGEDVEFGYRLEERGARFYFLADAVVAHESDHPLAHWLRIPYQYGHKDVTMARDHGRTHALDLAYRTRHTRHPLTRLAVRWCVGHPVRGALAEGSLRRLVAYTGPFAARRLQVGLCGLLHNIAYWQGVADATGLGARAWLAPCPPVPSAGNTPSGVAAAEPSPPH